MSMIYKYPVEIDVSSYVMLPKNSKVFSLVLNGDDEAYVYAIVDSKEEKKKEEKFSGQEQVGN